MRLVLCLVLLAAAPVAAQLSFTNVTPFPPNANDFLWGVSWIDYDGDGDLDLFGANSTVTDGNRLWRNDGGDAFTPVTGTALTQGNGGVGHCWGDVDNDGDPDLLTAGGGGFADTGGQSYLYRNDGGGTYVRLADGVIGPPGAGNRAWTCAWGDYDNDGWLDVVLVHPRGFMGEPSQPNHLFRNRGDGTFARVTDSPVVTGLAPYTVPTWNDYDQDGDLDLFIGSGPADGTLATDFLYQNQWAETGTASFTRLTTAPIATDRRDGQVMNWQDIDNDGDFDLFVTNYWASRADDLYVSNGDGTFTRITGVPLTTDITGLALANTWGDLDNDGDLDVLVTSASSQGVTGFNRLYLNNGDGTFVRVTSLAPLLFGSRSASLGDYDGDGDLDIAFARGGPSGPAQIFRNDLPAGTAWLKLDLVGTASNRSAIGAKVRVTATVNGQAVTQLREVSSQNTFNAMNALTVHIGLGDAAVADRVEIAWPSGQVDVFTGVAVRAAYRAAEGAGLQPVAAAPDGSTGALLDTPPYPNPTATAATFGFTLDRPQPIRLTVYDLLGRTVWQHAAPMLSAGAHRLTWDVGPRVPSGVYHYHLQTATARTAGRLTVAR